MKIKYLIVGFIILSSVVLTSGFLFFPNLFFYESIAKTSSVWTQETGTGISIPACASSSPPPSAIATCNGATPSVVTFTWSVEGPDPDGIVCASASITAGPSGGSQPVIATGLPCAGGSYEWSVATPFNTEYSYSINFENGGHIIHSGTFRTPGYCIAPPPLPPPPTVSCSVDPTSAIIGQNVTWTAVSSGGTAGAASGSINQSFSSGWSPVWMTSGQDQTISARRFQATSAYWLKKVSLALSREATLTGRIRVTIENDAGGLPSGSAIIGGTSNLVDVSIISVWTGFSWIDFIFPGVELTAGTNYWIVLRGYFDSGPANSIIHHAGAPADSNPGSKSLIRNWTSSSVWTDLTALGQDLWYRTYAAASPPSYSYSWPGSTPPLNSQTVNPVDISYPSNGDKLGNVTVISGGQTSEPSACSNFVAVSGPPPPGDFTLSSSGANCNSVPLSWTASSNADAYRILRGSPRVDISPYQPYTALNFTDTTVSENTTYLYQIEAYNISGTKRSNTISVTTPFCPPTLAFSGDPTTIYQSQSTTLTWSTTYATSCTASGAWSGFKPLNGSEVVFPSPPPSVTYNLQCSGPGGTTPVQPVTITVTPFAFPEWKEIIPR